MPDDEQKSRNRPKNHARSAIISLATYVSKDNCITRITMRRGINSVSLVRLSKKTKRSTYDSNQAMADPTADLRQQFADHEADKDK